MFEVKFLAFAACVGLLFLFDQGINCEEGKIKFIHQGHCAAGSGWIWPNSKQKTIDDCLKECKSRAANAKYFAYSPGKQGCACYKTDCKYDGGHMDYKSYEILQPGRILNSFCEGRYACETIDSLKHGQKICRSDTKCSHVYDFGCDQKVFCLCPKGSKILKSERNSCLFQKEE